ncbi:MAG: hypothetical protein ACRDPY_24120 [Streptosporangiaceae bacterium]
MPADPPARDGHQPGRREPAAGIGDSGYDRLADGVQLGGHVVQLAERKGLHQRALRELRREHGKDALARPVR